MVAITDIDMVAITDAMIRPYLHHQEIYDCHMPCIKISNKNLHRTNWYLTMWCNATLAKIFEMCTSCNDIKILLHSFTCRYLTIWWIATITIIQTCYIWKCMSSLDIIFKEIHYDRNHDGNMSLEFIKFLNSRSMAYRQGELRLTPLSIDCHHQKGGDCWISDFDDEVNCHLLSNVCVEISVQD